MNFIWQVLRTATIVYFVLGVFCTGIYVAAMALNNKYDERVTPRSEIARTAFQTLIMWPMLVYYLTQGVQEDE